MVRQFEAAYRTRYSFLMPHRALVAEAVSVEAIGVVRCALGSHAAVQHRRGPPPAADIVDMHTGGTWHRTPVFRRDALQPGDTIKGPAIIAEANATTVVEPGLAGGSDAARSPGAHAHRRRARTAPPSAPVSIR